MVFGAGPPTVAVTLYQEEGEPTEEALPRAMTVAGRSRQSCSRGAPKPALERRVVFTIRKGSQPFGERCAGSAAGKRIVTSDGPPWVPRPRRTISWSGHQSRAPVAEEGHGRERDAPGGVHSLAEATLATPLTTCSVMTSKWTSFELPKLVEIATSVASRPVAIRIRPILGVLWRASKVYQCPPR